ncbi:probable cytochrome P450 49a1 [Ornithodoros turicata]|uniref:probable cytochrome P450 49a1 n=1 Tax=Ornithodoros turicata TaxID=34597 RepID=UPI00313A2B2A
MTARANFLRALSCTRVQYRCVTASTAEAALNLDSAKPFSDIPRVTSLPLIGSSWMYWPVIGKYDPDKGHEAAFDMYRKHGPIVVEKLAGRYPLVHLFSADDFQTMYQHEGKTPFRLGATAFKKYRASRPQYYDNIGILNMQGEEWYHTRSRSQPYTLRPRTAMSYAPSMSQIADDAIRVITLSRDSMSEVPDCYPIVYNWAMESVTRASLDTRVGCLEHPLDPTSDGAIILKSMDTIFRCMQIFGYRFPYFRYFRTPTWKKFEDAMDTFTVKIFKHVEAAAERVKAKEPDDDYTILEHLLAEQKMEFGEVLAFMSDFILGGADTTSSTATFFLYHLAKNPEAQEKARAEIQTIVGPGVTSIQASHLSHMPYVKACLRESLRLNPTLSGVFRKLDHDVVMSGYVIPAGTVMFTENYVACRLAENFSRPLSFEPERWLKENKKDSSDVLHPYAALPFSFGPRMCLGRRIAELELWILAVKVLSKFRVEYHYEDIGFRGKLTNAPDKPARYRFIDLS